MFLATYTDEARRGSRQEDNSKIEPKGLLLLLKFGF